MKKRTQLTGNKIIRTLEKHKSEICQHGIKRIGLFGSFLKKNQHKKSDIDFLVTFNQPTFDNYMGLKFLLEKLFHKKVDLVVEENLKPALRYIKREVTYVK